MSLKTYPDVVQGTQEWHRLRCGIITASQVGKLLTPTLKVARNDYSRAVTAAVIAERVAGFAEDTPMTSDMWRGVEAEPVARDLYAKHYAPVTEIGFMVREWDGATIGYSPDGLVGDDGLIEIKAPRAKTHVQTILADEVPANHMAQLQSGLLVSGRKWIDFVSFSGGLPLFVKRIYPDPAWQEAILAAVTEFEATASQMLADFNAASKDLPPTERLNTELEVVI